MGSAMLRAIVLAAALMLLPSFAALSADRDPVFYKIKIEQDTLQGAVDFSHINHNITLEDKVFIRNGHFYRVGRDFKPFTDDDQRVRFYGVNLSFGANFPEEKDAGKVARRLRKLGINVVRLTHLDTRPDRVENEAESILTGGPYPTFNKIAVRRLRHFLDALKTEGIYADINIHVGYTFRPTVDGVPPVSASLQMPPKSKPLYIFYPRMIELQKRYIDSLFKELKLAGDPVLAMVEISNEDSLLHAWQTDELRSIAGPYREELEKRWKTFLVQRKERRDSASAHDEDDAVYLEFLSTLQKRYFDEMASAIRLAVGGNIPITGTQLNFGGYAMIDPQKDLGFYDIHFYHDHYRFPHKQWDPSDWRIRNTSQIETGLKELLGIMAIRPAGAPFTVSEFNEPWPNSYGMEIAPLLSVVAAFQDWDGLMFFNYANNRRWDADAPAGFGLIGDWGKFPNFGQSAWLFRTGAIQAGKTPFDIRLSSSMRLLSGGKRIHVGEYAEYLARNIGYDPGVAFEHMVRIVDHGAATSPLVSSIEPYRADTGEFTYEKNKLFLIDARMVSGVIGQLGPNRTVTVGGIDVHHESSGSGFLCILITSLDGKDVKESKRLLMSVPGSTFRSRAIDVSRPDELVRYRTNPMWWTLRGETGMPSQDLFEGGSAPVWMARVNIILTFHRSVDDVKVYPLDGSGRRYPALSSGSVAIDREAKTVTVRNRKQQPAPWYEIVIS